MLANAHRGARRSEPYSAEDFIQWRDTDEDVEEAGSDDEPELLDDPVAQSDLIRAVMFGLAPRSAPDKVL